MSRIAVLGAQGMLGRDLMSILEDYDVTGFSKSHLDITNEQAVRESLAGFDTVINAAAYTKVDDAETREELALAINGAGAGNIARVCKELGARLIHVSTDYVFDGDATTPYPEDAPRAPRSVYGKSKTAGEEAVLAEHPDDSVIIRTAWLYGEHGQNFVSTMLRLGAEHDTVSVVTDQVGQPTWSRDLARMISSLVDSPVRSGVFHGTNSGKASWWDFARAIFEHAGWNPERVHPTRSAEFIRPAPRPTWSVLGHEQWQANGLPTPRGWQEAFDEAWTEVFAHMVPGS